MNTGEWQFDWVHLNESMSIYFRIRQEESPTGVPRHHVETLAYMQKLSAKEGLSRTEYRAIMHTPENVFEMSVPRSPYPMQIMDFIQTHFTHSP